MKNRKSSSILMFAAILLVFVFSTSIALIERLNVFLLDDSGAIPLFADTEFMPVELTPDNDGSLPQADHSDTDKPQQNEAQQSSAIADEKHTNPQDRTEKPLPQVDKNLLAGTDTGTDGGVHTLSTENNDRPTGLLLPRGQTKGGFYTEDEKQIWTTETHVDIFSVSYENGEGHITVNSEDGDKVFAPGTENSYTFKLKNNSNTSAQYTVDVRAYFTPDDIDLPIEGRINRYDGLYLSTFSTDYTADEDIGGDDIITDDIIPEEGEVTEDGFRDVIELDGVHDEDTLGPGKYTYYTLDWRWPFERGMDEEDTAFGNRAVDEDLTLTIEIITTATITDQPGGGITPPDTGDDTNNILWMCLIFGSVLLIVLLVYYKKSLKEEEREG